MTRTASRVATATQISDGDAELIEVTDERDAPNVEVDDVEVDDVLVEEVSIDGLCGVY